MTTAQAKPGNSGVALFVLMLVSIFSYLDRTILSILQVPIKKELGLSDGQLGLLTGLAFALFYATLAVPIARVADRSNRKLLIVASLAVWSLMTALSGLATGFATLVFFRIGVALGEAGSIPASHTILADYFRPDKRATALAVWGLALPIGVMLGYLSGGWLAQAIDWRAAFAIVGGAGLVLAPIVLVMLREPQRGRHDAVASLGAPSPPWREALVILARLKSFRMMLLGGSLNNFVLSVVLAWSAPFYTRLHGLTLGQVASALALLTGIGGAVGIFAGGWLTDRIGRSNASLRPRAVGFALAMVTPLGLIQYLVPSVTLSIGSGALVVMLLFFYYAPIIALSHAVVSPSMRAFTSSIILLSVNIVGLGLGPWLTGVLSDALKAEFGPAAIRYAVAAVMVLGLGAGLCFLAAARSYNADLAKVRGGEAKA